MSYPPLPKPRPTSRPFLSPPQEVILRALLAYFYLTSRQVCRLLYAAGSLTYVQTTLKHLTEAGFCQRIFLPRLAQYGSAPSIYTLARKGLNYLRDQGLEVPSRYHPSEQREHSYLFLSHTGALNDTLIALALLSCRFPQIAVQTMLHERALKHEPMYVKDGAGNKLVVVMDAWLDLRLNGGQKMCLGLEIDLGTEEQRKWRRKVQGLVACTRGLYQERFGTTSLTLAVLATPGEKRCADLLRWTELELSGLPEKEDAADLFRFASFSPATADPEEMFLSPGWYRPFSPTPLPLIEGVPWEPGR